MFEVRFGVIVYAITINPFAQTTKPEARFGVNSLCVKAWGSVVCVYLCAYAWVSVGVALIHVHTEREVQWGLGFRV